MKHKLLNILFATILLGGICVGLYPFVSEMITKYQQKDVVQQYSEEVENISDEKYAEILEKAQAYNTYISQYASLSQSSVYEKSYTGEAYEAQLDAGGIGVMGVLRIPRIDVELPIYHGTGQDELQVGIGHYRGSSLPIGGVGTHCVLSGHSGLPSSRLLTDVDQLEIGDVFYIDILNETLAYQVDQIEVVLPVDVDKITFDANEDYCTLVTCTPYGVNTHRLLVRGKRIPYVKVDSTVMNEVSVLPIYIPIGIVICCVLVIGNRKKRRKA